jgi:hypothetical protein
MKASLLRGDAWVLVQGMAVQLQNRWKQSIADSEARVKDMERRSKSLEDLKRLKGQGTNNRRGSVDSGIDGESDSDSEARSQTNNSDKNL